MSTVLFLPTLHAAWEPGIEGFLKIFFRHPATQLASSSFRDWNGISLFLSDDDSFALNSCHISWISESQPAAFHQKSGNQTLIINIILLTLCGTGLAEKGTMLCKAKTSDRASITDNLKNQSDTYSHTNFFKTFQYERQIIWPRKFWLHINTPWPLMSVLFSVANFQGKVNLV